MESSVDSLSESFRRVTPAAIPAMLDCIMALTASSPTQLFSSLLDAFPKLTKQIDWSEKLDLEHSNHVGSYVGALCHLLKKSGANVAVLQSFIWRILIPLIKLGHDNDHEIVKEAVGSFFDLVIETSSWGVVEATIVPYLVRLVGLSMGMPQSEELAVYKWSMQLVKNHDDPLVDLDMCEDSMPSQSKPLPFPMACHLLTSLLDAAMQCKDAFRSTSGLLLANGHCAQILVVNLLWDLCNITVRMLSHSSEHRSCAINFFLPFIFKAYVLDCALEISVCGQTHILSRKRFLMKIWKCCKTLFFLGPLERRDAYAILSLYLTFFSCIDGCENADLGLGEEAFDLRAEKEFWGEIKKGLVDKESLVRKQSLHILKVTVLTNEENQRFSDVTENKKSSVPQNMTKKERWADKEAKSLGVGKICNSVDFGSDSQRKWGAFFLLYEMLEEYGTHLVEAAWNHQITLLLHISLPCINSLNPITGRVVPDQMQTLEGKFNWLGVLWERGFYHENPQVRCLIMESFLGIEWKNYGNCAKLVPEDFIFGSFIQGLNDPVHHKEFGIKGIYSSGTIEGAANFLRQYTSYLSLRRKIAFLSNLASVAKKHSFGRAGLMGLAECIASAACGSQTCDNNEVENCVNDMSEIVQVESALESYSYNNKEELLDGLRFVIESSRQHFNPNYRLKVCEKILHAAASVVSVFDVSLELLLHFISSLPQDSTDYGGPLRMKVQEWLWSCEDKHYSSTYGSTSVRILKSLDSFPTRFISHHHLEDGFITYDDEDVEMWEFEAKRWARVLFIIIKEEHHLDPTLMFIQNHGMDLCKQNNHLAWLPMKFLILILTLVQEFQVMNDRTADSGMKGRTKPDLSLLEIVGAPSSKQALILTGKFAKSLTSALEGLISFAQLSCSIFWSRRLMEDTDLPCSVRGKLGGPSQRRLSPFTMTVILQAIISVKSLASVSSWCAQFGSDNSLKSAFTFLWQLSWKIIQSPTCSSESEAEICIGAFEALAYVLKAIAFTSSPLALDFLVENYKSLSPKAEHEPLLDSLLQAFLQGINNVIAVGELVRSRRAILMNWKWICLESLLSIPGNALRNGVYLPSSNFLFSDTMVRWIFGDLVESLENAGEGSVLPMLRSVRLVLRLFALGRMGSVVSSCNGVDVQMMWHLVRSSWILHISCNKRRVAPIAALLSSGLHYSVFNDEAMHEVDNAPGPLKWLVQKILEEGVRSPRTIRLAALHLTGIWLLNPNTIKYYMKELKILTLYGSVAFDEDFKGELADNLDAKSEVSVLAKSPDPELTEEFINTELYARVSVAVLFYKLADLVDMVGSKGEHVNSRAAHEAGKMFCLELLDSAINDKDLGKELYKKYSAIHRRKVRVWQMICILARFIDRDIVHKVTCNLHIALRRNNLPAVRQYLETFAIYIYLKFPLLVGEELAPLLRDYDMRSQALSSYVFIAANVILHATEAVQYSNLNELLPPIIPLLTSHHHTLRGFTQLLVHQVLSKLLPALDSSTTGTISLEKKCFVDLKSFLEGNTDCSKLRASMGGYLSDFNPENSITPYGIFSNRVAEGEFECVPTSLMERVIDFLNNVREDLRFSMAKDAATLKNEHFQINEDPKYKEMPVNVNKEELVAQLPTDISLDFQKKVTFPKHEMQDANSRFFLGNHQTHKTLTDMEKEDQLLDQVLHSRGLALEKSRADRQHIILVASLLDRIPNLAGLARTCEVFKAAALAIADTNVLHDKQFQLISVTAEKWVPIIEVPTSSIKFFLEKRQREGFSILGLEQTANSIPLDKYVFPKKSVLVLGREKEGIPVELIHILDACIEIPQLGIVRSLNVHVSGAIALWEYTRQQRSQ